MYMSPSYIKVNKFAFSGIHFMLSALTLESIDLLSKLKVKTVSFYFNLKVLMFYITIIQFIKLKYQ